MKNKLYFDVVHDAHNGKARRGWCTTLMTTRWILPILDFDDLHDIVMHINDFQERTSGLPLQCPDEGYSCTVEAEAEYIICFLLGKLNEDPNITDLERGLLDVRNAFHEILQFLEFHTVPETKYINITLTAE